MTVDLQEISDYLENHMILGIKASTLVWLLTIVIVAVVLERIITRYLSRFARRAHLAPNVANSLVLTFRLLILIGAVASAVKVGGLSTEWIVALSAMGGAAVGFASTKTIGNFIAGLYLLAARPFRVGDYMKVETVEGIIDEITINYTKILTIGNNVVSISNLQVMDRDIVNYMYKDSEGNSSYCYTFEIGFDHSVSTTEIAKIFDDVFEQYKSKFKKRPSYMLTRSGSFERIYTVYLYVAHPTDVFNFRPLMAEEVFKRWDSKRPKK